MATPPAQPPKKDRKRELNQPPLTVEHRKHRIAELYRLRMKLDEWYIKANGKDLESQVKSKVLNGVILYVKNRIEYLALMNPPIENPSQHKPETAAASQSPPSKEAGPGGTDTKR